MKIIAVLLLATAAALAQNPDAAVARVDITAGGHPCAKCNVNLPDAIQQANPGAHNIEVNGSHVAFQPGKGAIDWKLLRKLFDEQERPIMEIRLLNRNGKMIERK